jgi:hypothetical protein
MTYSTTAEQIWLADIADDRCTIGSGDQEIARDIPLNIGRLMAAAPDMLDMLYCLLPFIEDIEADTAYKPGIVRQLRLEMLAVIDRAENE